jgi:hypothetical protein
MIPEEETLSDRFGLWLMEQDELGPEGIPASELLNIVGNIVALLRPTFKAIEIPHLLSWVAYRVEMNIRKDGGLLMYASADRTDPHRIPLAEETNEDSELIDFLYSNTPDDLSGMEGDNE